MMRSHPCACGVTVRALALDPFPMVRAHVLAEPHRSWSDRSSLVPREPSSDSTARLRPVDVSRASRVRPVRRALWGRMAVR